MGSRRETRVKAFRVFVGFRFLVFVFEISDHLEHHLVDLKEIRG